MNQPLPQPSPVLAPDAVLKFTVQGNVMTSNLIAPKLAIDGYPGSVPVVGTREFPIMSGRHRLEAHSQWLRRYGHAVIDIDVAPGQALEVFYAPPYHQFADEGAMGFAPQPRKGRGAMIAVWVGVGLTVGLALATLATVVAVVLTQ